MFRITIFKSIAGRCTGTRLCEYKFSDTAKQNPIIADATENKSSSDVQTASGSKKESKRLEEFRKKLRETTPLGDLGDQPLTPPSVKEDPLPPWPDNKNPHTGEINGPRGPEPTRYGDWERKGRVSDF